MMSREVSREEDKMKKPAKKRRARKTAKPARTARARTKKIRARAPTKSRAKAARKRAAPGRKKAFVKRTKRVAVKKTRPPAVTARRAPKEVLGEGNYTAARRFRQGETRFVQRHRDKIAELGQEAEVTLEGGERNALEDAAARAASHSHSPGEDV
jgi:hypothetical protein